jgi:hypothetical protein
MVLRVWCVWAPGGNGTAWGPMDGSSHYWSRKGHRTCRNTPDMYSYTVNTVLYVHVAISVHDDHKQLQTGMASRRWVHSLQESEWPRTEAAGNFQCNIEAQVQYAIFTNMYLGQWLFGHETTQSIDLCVHGGRIGQHKLVCFWHPRHAMHHAAQL